MLARQKTARFAVNLWSSGKVPTPLPASPRNRRAAWLQRRAIRRESHATAVPGVSEPCLKRTRQAFRTEGRCMGTVRKIATGATDRDWPDRSRLHNKIESIRRAVSTGSMPINVSKLSPDSVRSTSGVRRVAATGIGKPSSRARKISAAARFPPADWPPKKISAGSCRSRSAR
jgi:hypothetical protein